MVQVKKKIDPFEEYNKSYRHYQKLMNGDIVVYGNDKKSKMTIFNPTTSIGKTYMVPGIAKIANDHGCKFIYACNTKTSINEVYKEFTHERFKGYYTDPKSRRLLLIPSIKDGYINFFQSDKKNKEDKLPGLPICTADDFNRMSNMVSSSKDARLETAFKNVQEITALLSDKYADAKSQYLDLDHAFSECEIVIQNYLRRTFRKEFFKEKECPTGGKKRIEYIKASKERMLEQYPFVGKLYPGFLYDFADVVLVTYKKLLQNIDPIGVSTGSFVEPGNAQDANKWLFLDECDQICDPLFDSSLDTAMNGQVELVSLISAIGDFVTACLEIPDKNKEDKDKDKDKDKEENEPLKLIVNPKLLSQEPDAKTDNEILRKLIIELKGEIDRFAVEKAGIVLENRGRFEFVTDKAENGNGEGSNASGNNIIPKLIVSEDTSTYILTETLKKECDDKNATVELVVKKEPKENVLKCQVVYFPKSSGDDDKSKRPELPDGEFYYKDFVSDSMRIVNHFFRIFRKFYENYTRSHHGGIATVQAREACYNILEMFHINATDLRRYIFANLIVNASKSVKWEGFYARGISMNYLNTANDLTTGIYVESVSKMPEYYVSNLVINSQKTIFCSATANLKSLRMVDIEAVKESVAKYYMHWDYNTVDADWREKQILQRKEEEERAAEIAKNAENTMFKLPHIKEACDELAKLREADYKAKKIMISCGIHYQPDPNNREYADLGKGAEACEAIEMLMGEQLPVDIRDAWNIDFKTNDLEFVVFAMDDMLSNSLSSGIVYMNSLPAVELGRDPEKRLMPTPYHINTITYIADKLQKKYDRVLNVEAYTSKQSGLIEARRTESKLLVSAYLSTGAGSNIMVRYNQNDNDKEDLQAGYFGEIRNVIPAPKADTDMDERIRTCFTEYYFYDKYGLIMNQGRPIEKGSPFWKVWWYLMEEALPKSLPLRGEGKFKREPFMYLSEPCTPYKEEKKKIMLQAVNRIERGHRNIEGSMIRMVFSNRAVYSDGVKILSSKAYEGTPTGYVFGECLKVLDGEKIESDMPPMKLSDEYTRRNTECTTAVRRFVDNIANGKRTGGFKVFIPRYKSIRAAVTCCGWDEGKQIPELFFTQWNGSDITGLYAAQKGKKSDADRDGCLTARLVSKSAPEGIDISSHGLRRGVIDTLEFFENNGYFGTGYEKCFGEMLNYREQIREHGYKYIPFASTHDIFMGEFAEMCYEAASLPEGRLNIEGFNVVPYHEEAYEDFDFYYSGTHVVVDVKGYHVGNSPSNGAKLTEKLERYKKLFGRYPVVIFLNMALMDNAKLSANRFTTVEGAEYYLVNSIADPDPEKDGYNLLFAQKVRSLLLQLCQDNRCKEEVS